MKSKLQRGAQAIEFALVLPFFLILLLLIIDFGFLVFNKAVITNASREAARSGTVVTGASWSPAAVSQVACNYARGLLISTSDGTRTASCTGTADPTISVANPNGHVPPQFGDPISVTVNFTYEGFLISFMDTVVGPWTLVASSTMNHE